MLPSLHISTCLGLAIKAHAVKLTCCCAGENWTAAKKASDPKTSRLPSLSDFNNSVNPASAVNALNGVFKRLMTLGDLNLYNYTAGMPALYGTANNYRNGNGNVKVNGTSLPSLDKAEGLQRRVNSVSKDSVQVWFVVLVQYHIKPMVERQAADPSLYQDLPSWMSTSLCCTASNLQD